MLSLFCGKYLIINCASLLKIMANYILIELIDNYYVK